MVVIHKKKEESAEEKEARLQKEKEISMGLQDEYQARGFELVTWTQQHKSKVVVFIAVILATGLGVGTYFFYRDRAATLASMEYLEAVHKLEEASMGESDESKTKATEEALQSLKQLALNFKGSNVAVLANIQAAHLAMSQENSADAVTYYETALGQITKTDKLYPLVAIGLAYAYQNTNQADKALGVFENLITDKHSATMELALYEASKLLLASKELDKASAYLARLLDEYPSSVYGNDAKRLQSGIE